MAVIENHFQKLASEHLKWLTLLLAAIVSALAAGQSPRGSVEGVVRSEESGEPLAGVTVEVAGTGLNTATSGDGQFRLEDLAAGEVEVRFSLLGHDRVVKRARVSEGQTARCEVFLPTDPVPLPPVDISANRFDLIGSTANLQWIPGTAHRIVRSDLDRFSYGDVHRVLTEIPGIHVQDEEGFGNRANIGMRGTGVTRSEKITLMEDGVLIAPAPYSAPAAYYFPTVGRMEGIEVRMGSSQIKYGPNTNGGAVNLVSTSIPQEFSTRATLNLGAFNTFRLHGYAGNDAERMGWLVETHIHGSDGFKLLDNGGSTGFDKRDYLAKFRLTPQALEQRMGDLTLKVSAAEETSNETYLGLTDEDFTVEPFRRYLASQRDHFASEHRQVQLTHRLAGRRSWELVTRAYQNQFRRNWYKLDKSGGVSIASVVNNPEVYPDQFALLTAPNGEPGSLNVKANNRSYLSQGVEQLLHLRRESGRVRQEMEGGIRLHEDYEDRFQHVDGYQMVDRRMILTGEGAPGSSDNRIGSARVGSVFVQDLITIGRWSLIPGIRYENITLKREDFSKTDPGRDQRSEVAVRTLSVTIPGLGVSFRPVAGVTLFGGVHKGFSPPAPGKAEEIARAEESVNSEVGVRIHRINWMATASAYVNRYMNMLGSDLSAGGGQGSGDQFNAGEVTAYGAEGAIGFRLRTTSLSFPMQLSYTFTDARFETEFKSAFEPWGHVKEGDELPYLSRHQFFAMAAAEGERWKVSLAGRGASAMRTEAGQGELNSEKRTDSHMVLDFSGDYLVGSGFHITFSANNLSDVTYIAARQPAGIRPGLPRTLLLGLKFQI